MTEQLRHTRGCSAWHEEVTNNEVNAEACTCGLRFRIQTQTAETLLTAWQKRCVEAEQERNDARLALAATVEKCSKVALQETSDCTDSVYIDACEQCAAAIRATVSPVTLEEVRKMREQANLYAVLRQAADEEYVEFWLSGRRPRYHVNSAEELDSICAAIDEARGK